MQSILTNTLEIIVTIFIATFLYDLTRCVVIPAWNASTPKLSTEAIAETIEKVELVELSKLLSEEPKIAVEDTKPPIMVDNPKLEKPDLLERPGVVPLSKTKIKKLKKQELIDELVKAGIEPKAKLGEMRSHLLQFCS